MSNFFLGEWALKGIYDLYPRSSLKILKLIKFLAKR